jgi:predicted O-methyltransferase YrrM
MDITNPAIEDYIRGLLARHDEPVLLEMEAEAKERGFPIVGRMVGVVLEILARSIGAKRVFELGSGFGYSGYWFSRAVGPDGELHLTDGDPENEKKAADYLGRAGLDGPVTFHVGDAVTSLEAVEGDFDVVYCDIDKHGYPEAWRASRDRVRPGGFYICDNTLWSGRVTGATGADPDPHAGWTEAIIEMNRAAASDPAYLTTILPIRDGVLVAHRFAEVGASDQRPRLSPPGGRPGRP